MFRRALKRRFVFKSTQRTSDMLSNINSILNVRPKEKRVVALTLLLSFFTGSAISFVYSSSRALFLTCFGTYDLAYVFIGGAFAVLGVGAVYAKFEERVPFNKLLIGTILFLIASFVGFRLWLLFGEAKWPSLMLAIWFEAFSVLISLCFWGLCNHLFNVRQAKRLFGLIGAGEYVAIILAGFATPVLVRFTGTPNLLFVACTGLTFAAGLTIYITRLFSSQLVSAKSTG